MESRSFRWLAMIWLVAGVAGAQAPVVPTDHYGPPVCSAAAVPAHRMTAEAAKAEQEQGADDSHAILSAEPVENFAIARYRLADYADCVGTNGCYWADLDAQYRRAEVALATAVAAKKPGEKLAVVMDIDETALSSYCEMKHEDFGYVGPLFNAWIVSPEASVAIPGGLRFFNKAKAAGVSVFFITGRAGVPDYSSGKPAADQTEATARNLEAAGYRGWAGLVLRNGGENTVSTIEYKSEERHRIADKGYRIVMSVGDQWSDLLGEPKAEVSVKLPNPFYFLP
ncbi:HAD family acid phosphatase [Granulicella mallensis]|uniref:Acid phosphatase (Class B) n=1 Tax=Granulicella mallensis (strain ATCC BAA-1857 / DSM 23137 / MP5ACTX8) TaxID=682795 RepID=G8P036_GRAMM|nr:HAD family acid phosphatase [Granulicella mallensis]AEU35752.1 acid phosphatase (Class B) [Granulicella mallensis MP5ACTX8]